MKTLLLDDEPLALDLLKTYVASHPALELAAAFTNPVDGLAYVRKHPVDVLLLDVQMPELNGLHVARLLGDECAIILTTAYEQYALESYDLAVTDYLLKPISRPRFDRAIEKLTERRPGPPVASATAHPPFFVKSGHRNLRVDLEDLLYASSAGDYLSLHLTNDRRILTLENMGDFSARLPATGFCRIHRSHLVALAKIDFVERRRVVIGEAWLPVSDGYWEGFSAYFG